MPTLFNRKYLIGFFCVTLLLLVSVPTFAKPKRKPRIVINPNISIREYLDDNVYQTGTLEQSDFVSEISPGFDIDVSAIKYIKIAGGYSAQIFYYPSNSNLNDFFHQINFDVGLDLSRFHKWRNFRLGLEMDYDPVAISATNSTGATFNTTQRFTGALVPGYNFQFNPTLDLDLEARFQRTMYSGQGENFYAGDFLATLRKRILRRIYLRLSGGGTYQKFDDIGTTLIYGGDIGIDLEIIKRLDGGISIGYQLIDLPNGASTSNALTFGVNLDYLLSKRTTFELRGTRSNSVDLVGNDHLTTTASFGVRHRLSMKTLFGLDVFYRLVEQESYISNIMALQGDDLNSFGGSLRMQYTQHWTFGIFAIRDKNAGQVLVNDYTENRIGLEIRYQHPFTF